MDNISLDESKRFSNNKVSTIIVIFVVMLFIYLALFAAPIINIKYQINEVREKNYKIFITNHNLPYEISSRNNCRNLAYSVKIIKPSIFISDVKIEVDSLEEYLDNAQYLSKREHIFKKLGSFTGRGRNHYVEGIDVFSEGMTDEKLKDFFSDYKIEVTWKNIINGKYKAVFYLKDYFYY